MLLLSWLLRRARREHPEMFDGRLAWEQIEGAISEHDGAIEPELNILGDGRRWA